MNLLLVQPDLPTLPLRQRIQAGQRIEDQLRGSRQHEPRREAARAVGMSEGTYTRAKRLVTEAASDPALQPLVDAIDAGEITIYEANKRMKEVLDAMNTEAGTNGSGRSAHGRERPPTGMQKRTWLSATKRLNRIASALEGYADALPAMHTRGEDVTEILTRIEKAAGKVRRAAKGLHEGGST